MLSAILQSAHATALPLEGFPHTEDVAKQTLRLRQALLTALQQQLDSASGDERELLTQACCDVERGAWGKHTLWLVADYLSLKLHVLCKSTDGDQLMVNVYTGELSGFNHCGGVGPDEFANLLLSFLLLIKVVADFRGWYAEF